MISFIESRKKEYVPKQSPTFERKDIDQFLSEASNETFLIHKLALLIALNGGLRVEDELAFLQWEDVFESLEKEEIGIRLDKGTKTAEVGESFIFLLVPHSDKCKCPVQYFNLYKEKVPENQRTGRLFRRFKGSEITAAPYGKSFFCSLPSKIAKFLNKENAETYTGQLSPSYWNHSYC